MNDPMQSPHDPLLDEALAHLRNTKPSSSMESRILSALEEHATRYRPRKRFLSPTALRTWSLCTVAASFAVAVAFVIHFNAARQAQTQTTTAQHNPPAAPSVTAATLIASAATHATSSQPHHHIPAARTDTSPMPGEPTVDSPDAVALAELHMPSHPAPAQPLTQQERLLKHVGNHPDSVQLAALDPDTRASLDARDSAAFHHFFDHPLLPQPAFPPYEPGDINAH
jgi:hypothetical protein